MMKAIPFYKMSGSGNDFIIIDNRQAIVPENDLPGFVANICRRRISVGADGVILVENSAQVDFKWRFFNADGSVAEMCGNGARCVARFAYLTGIAGTRMSFETEAGLIMAQVIGEQAKIRMTDPQNLVLSQHIELENQTATFGQVNTGVPHVVIEVEDIEAVDVVGLGRRIRHHPHFAPAGTNANFVAALTPGLWSIRTYERGVEDETLACGTGNVAAALVLAAKYNVASPVTLKTRSGSDLKVYFHKQDGRFGDVFLEGDARIIYQGQLQPEAWQSLT